MAIALLSLIAGYVAAQPAGGGGIEVIYNPKLPDKTNEKTKDDIPVIETTIIGAPNVTPDKFVLVDKTTKPAIEVKASKVVDFKKGTETLAVALVVNGAETWMGNDKEIPEVPDHEKRPGVLIELRTALDQLKFGEAGPPGSKGMIITYGNKASIRVPMGPLSNVTGSALGTQNDYFKQTGRELVQGINLALSELHAVVAARKVLIVVSDGTDTNMEAAKAAMPNLKKQAKDDNIQTFAIVYKTADSEPTNVIGLMIPQTTQVNGAQNIAATVQSILARMDDRKYVTFPGYNKATDVGFAWDGKTHKLMVRIDKDETDETEVVLGVWDAGKGGGFPWLILVIILVGLLLLIIIMVKVLSKKEVIVAPPAPIAAPAMPQPEAPKPAGPAKTVMLGRDGDDQGFPVVGWLVPLNGPAAYQTMRLRTSGTKIGTAAPADIVVNDGFMSTEHCQIHCSPQGYVLIDNGSTNGSYVNDRKIAGRHELVDNDLITLGKTNFKFKSIV